MNRFNSLLLGLALASLPLTASAQFVPPDDGYTPPPPPTTPAPPTSPSAAPQTRAPAPAANRPLSYSERMRLKKQKEEKAKAVANRHAAASGAGAAAAETRTQPNDFSIGVGAGWQWSMWSIHLADPSANAGTATSPGPGAGRGTDLLTPNVASMRIRFNESVALEPGLILGMGNSKSALNVPNPGTDTLDRVDGYGVIANLALRYGFMHRAATSAVLIVGLDAGVAGVQVNPEGTKNNTQALSTMLGLSWGLGVDWFITPHFALSGDVVSPLVQLQSVKMVDPNADTTRTGSSLDLGLAFNPGARLMFHVYY